jgi:hypothetical protein
METRPDRSGLSSRFSEIKAQRWRYFLTDQSAVR